MAEVAIAVAMSAATAGAGVAIGSITLTQAAVAVATTAITASLSYELRPKAETGALAPSPAQPAPANADRNFIVKQAVPPRRFVYGACRTGGVLFFQENKNPWLYVGTLISDGTIESIDAVYFGDNTIGVDGSGNAVTGTAYTGNFKLEKGLGGVSQAASAALLAAFPGTIDADFKQTNIARAVAQMHWGVDTQTHSVIWGGDISPVYVVKGVKVYDPRIVGHDVADPTTWAYSNNPALCVAHAMLNVWHTPLTAADIDWPSVITAANICDETLTYNGATVKRFVLGGVLQADAEIAPQVAAMLAAMGGAITFNDGKYSIFADTERTAVWTIQDDDILEVGEVQHDVASADYYGAISADYYDGGDTGRRATTPTYTLSATERKTAISLLFCAAPHSAQILAYRQLLKSRAPRSFTLTVTDAGLWLVPVADLVTIASVAAPFLNGTYYVEQVDLQQVGAAIKLREYVSAAYADPAGYLV